MEVSYEDNLEACAVATSNGTVCVVSLGTLDHGAGRQTGASEHLILKHERHEGTRVTQLAWVRANDESLHLSSGDETGKVHVTNVTAEVARVERQRQAKLFSPND